MHVSSTGTKTIQYIDAGPGPANGIIDLNAADLDGDHITDFVYAGDVLGNLWRFDLTSATNTDWNTAVTKIFTTASGQPISTQPLIVETPAVSASGLPKLMIVVGTGQKLPLTATSAEVYASGTQTIYGVWDSSLSAWNATTTDEKYDTATGVTLPLTPSSLTAHSITNVAGTDGGSYRAVSMEAICWKGSTACPSGNTSMGYKINLPGTNEQIIYNAQFDNDQWKLNTLIPQSTQALTCGVTPASSFTMSIDVATGTGVNAPYTDGSGNYYSGFSQNGTGVVGTYNYNGNTYDGTETNTGDWTSKRHYRRGGQLSRVTWTKVR
jgi:type IV pilus assembly protein PilY1